MRRRFPQQGSVLILAALGCWFVGVPALNGADAAKLTYDDHLVPVLRDKCFGCHNPDKSRGGLVLTTYSRLMEGGSSGAVVDPGNAEGSRLFELVAHTKEPKMPPKADKLPAESLELVRAWIAGGALESSTSRARPARPRTNLALATAPTQKPEGPPPMPSSLLDLEPVVVTARSTAITALAASPWAPLVAIGAQRQILLYHTETLELLGVLPFAEGVAHSLRFSRNGSLLVAGGGHGAKLGRVVAWSVATGERVVEVGDELDGALVADISADQSLIALGGPSKLVRIFSTEDRQQLLELKKHTDWITALEFSPDGVLLATADRAGKIIIWEASTGREFHALAGHSLGITALSWRSDSNLLLSTGESASLKLWEMENGGVAKSWPGNAGGIQAAQFAPDGRIASAGRDRLVKIWDANGALQRDLEPFADIALRVVFSHDSSRVIAADWTGEVRVSSSIDGKILGRLLANPPAIATRLEIAAKELAAAVTAETARLKEIVDAGKATLSQALAELAQKEEQLKGLPAEAFLDGVSKAAETARKVREDLAGVQKAVTTASSELEAAVAAWVNAGQAASSSDSPRLASAHRELARWIRAREVHRLRAELVLLAASQATLDAAALESSALAEQLALELAAATQAVPGAKSELDQAASKLGEARKATESAQEELSDAVARLAGLDPAQASAELETARKRATDATALVNAQVTAWIATQGNYAMTAQAAANANNRVQDLSGKAASAQEKAAADKRSSDEARARFNSATAAIEKLGTDGSR